MPFDIVIGALEIASWVNCMLYMLEIVQAVSYFSNYTKDTALRKGAVLACLLTDTLTTLANCATVYFYTVSNWGVLEAIASQPWTIPAYLILTGVGETVVQIFLMHRYWTLTKHTIICGILFLMIMASFGGATSTGIMIVLAPSIKDRSILKIPVIVWFVVAVATDISIAALLIFQLRAQSSKSAFKQTKSLVNRLTSVTISSGSATAIVALVTLIVYLQNPEGNVATGFGQILGRVYTLTMLFNLNSRQYVRNGNSRGQISSHISRGEAAGEAHSLGGVHIHRTAVVTMDEAPSYDAKYTTSKVPYTGSAEDDHSSTNKSAPFA